MGALDRLAGRVRAKPWIAVVVAAGALLIAAWLGWAIYVASEQGVNEGVGVLIAWPALLVAVALVALPFAGVYLLVRGLSGESGDEDATAIDEGEPATEAEQTQATETG